MILIFLCSSCTKNQSLQKVSFIPTEVDGTPFINYDSITYTIVSYSDLTDEADTHTVNMNIRTDHLNLISGHTYVFNKFDMVGISGGIKYYVPSKSDTAAKDVLLRLPIHFTIPEDSGAGLVMTVAPFPY